MSAKNWTILNTPLEDEAESRQILARHIRDINRIKKHDDPKDHDQAIAKSLQEILVRVQKVHPKDRTALTAAVQIIADLARQGWHVRNRQGKVEVQTPVGDKNDPASEKARIRRQELVKRDEQLSQPSVRKFVLEMERSRFTESGIVSIFSLMRDGRELAESLSSIPNQSPDRKSELLKSVIDPYLQFVSEDAYCEFTRISLQNIWRYFRYTWSNQSTSIPGRTMAFLVRDRAAPMHPIVGIGALGSPIVQISERDAWIGWHPEVFFDHARENPSRKLGTWLQRVVHRGLAEIYVEDFLVEGVVTPKDLKTPNANAIQNLVEFGTQERRFHHRYVDSQEHKSKPPMAGKDTSEDIWVSKAKSHLFRSKRALSLAELLNARLVVERYLSKRPTEKQVGNLLADRDGARAVKRILRKAKADRVGIAMADITVCGAVPPYNPILGGKLVAMLSVSPEVIEAYRKRYGDAVSEIASSMAGRPIVRPSELVFFGTTSLYGMGSSQYNRVRIPAERLGGKAGEKIQFIQIGRSRAFGTSHFSNDTVQALEKLVRHANGGQRVNSIFGEGVSPKLRKVRDGLEALHYPSDQLLRHGRERIVYGIPVVRNTREFLLGLDEKPDYLFSEIGEKATVEICDWWRERWLARRIESEDVLNAVRQHTMIRPITHAARVVLPAEDPDQMGLFEERS